MENTLSKAHTLTLEKGVFQHFLTYFVFCLISKEQLNTTVCKNSRSPDFQMSNSRLVFKTNNVAKCSEASVRLQLCPITWSQISTVK